MTVKDAKQGTFGSSATTRLLAFALTLLTAACEQAPPLSGSTGPDIQVTQAGFLDAFELVEVVKPEQTIDLPIVRISGIDWTDQGFAIADVSEGNAKLFSPDGELLAVMGRKGQGPGEFQGVRYPQIVANDLVVADGATSRISTFRASGDFVSEVALSAGYVSDFVRLDNGDMVIAGNGLGHPDANMAVYAPGGELVTYGLYTNNTLPRDVDPDFPWTNLRQTYLTVSADTAWAVSTISDTIWSVPIADTLAPTARRLVIPGYAPPVPPERRPRTPRDLNEWAKGFHGAAPPVASDRLIAIPYVQGVLNYGDPMILVLRNPEGEWQALTGAPPIIAANGDQLIGIHNPLEDQVELAVYRYREQ